MRATRAPTVPRVDTQAALMDLGRRIAELRADRGWTQEQFAARLGVDPSHLRKIETGRLNVTVRTLVRVASALELAERAAMFQPPTSREVRVGRPRSRG
jgi:transcriptional regulator with XRE-family HTH domain